VNPLLIAVLLFQTPFIQSSNSLYMVCRSDGTHTVTELSSGEMIQKTTPEEFVMFNVDLTRNRIRSHKESKWNDIQVKGNSIVQEYKGVKQGIQANMYGEVPLNLPGPFLMNASFTNDQVKYQARSEGECREIDSSTWNEGVEMFNNTRSTS